MRAIVLAAMLAGCAAAPAPSVIERLPEGAAGPIAPARTRPVTLDEVVELARSGTPPQTIVQILRDSRATYALSAEEGRKLAARGVPAEVISHLRGIEQRPPRPYAYYPHPYFAHPYFGYPYPYYPWSGIHLGIGRRW
jgi:hypothetical protein